MKIGIISEGKGDLGVIDNILKGITNLDTSNFKHIRPSDDLDETDLALGDKTRSTWSLVKEECISGDAISSFFKLENSKYVVIHIDTDRAQDFEVNIPTRDENFCEVVRERVIEKINSWLDGRFPDCVFYAVAIEEIEAWLLTIYKPKKESSLQPNPKKALEFVLGKKGIDTTSSYNNYRQLSKPFLKEKEILVGKFLDYNCSLRLFYEEIKAMWAIENPNQA